MKNKKTDLEKRFLEIQEITKSEAKKLFSPHKKLKVLGISGSARDTFDMASEDSNSEFLLKKSLEYFSEQKIETELIPLRKYDIKPCKACYSTTNAHCHCPCSCYPKNTQIADDMSNIIYDKVLDADILLFATPVNNFKMSSLMSLFIDRLISLDGSLLPADPLSTKDKNLNIKHTDWISKNADLKVPGSGFLRRFTGKIAGIIVTGHEEGASMVISSLFLTLNHYGMIFPPWSFMYAMGDVRSSTNNDGKIQRGKLFVDEARDLAKNLSEMAKILKKQNKSIWLCEPGIN